LYDDVLSKRGGEGRGRERSEVRLIFPVETVLPRYDGAKGAFSYLPNKMENDNS